MSNLELETVPFAKAKEPKPELLHMLIMRRLRLAPPGEAVRIRKKGENPSDLRKRIDSGLRPLLAASGEKLRTAIEFDWVYLWIESSTGTEFE